MWLSMKKEAENIIVASDLHMIEKNITLESTIDLSKNNLAIGFFDGLHLGHRAILNEEKEDGQQLSLLTFDVEQLGAFKKDALTIYTNAERALLFSEARIESIFVLPFDIRTQNASKEDFLSFLQRLTPHRVLVGEDFRFGKGALGKAEDIRKAFPEKEVRILPLLCDEKGKISSSRIRSLLSEGDIENANRLLGRPYFVIGNVVHGRHNGHRLGFPTANLVLVNGKAYPSEGVYKTRTFVDSKVYPSMTNIGTHPTIDETVRKTLETHIHGFSGDLYGRSIRVEFLSRLRDQMRFSSAEDLENQLKEDLRRILSDA